MRRQAGRLVGAIIAAGTVVGCATPQGQMALESVGRGFVSLILAPFMIVAGIAQGLAFLPYTLGTGLAELNRALVEAHATSLDDAYRSTFGVALADPRVDQRSGEVEGESAGYGRYRPEAMLEATRAFQRLLVSQGMPEERARHYVLAGDYTHVRSRGHILLAVVYRHPGMQPIRVTSRQTGIVTMLRPEAMGWRQPYERDINGQLVDEVIDWAGFEYALLRQDRVVATLMVLATEAVKSGKRSADYWPAERRWIAGESEEVMRESHARIASALSSQASASDPRTPLPFPIR
jgi:hypothetical protein